MLQPFLLTCAGLGSALAPMDPPEDFLAAARAQVGVTTRYDGSYQRIPYPDGDVPMARGVCTDVLIRAYRKLGIDLQVQVHKDMASAWGAYPNLWKLKGPDANIDHRRVPNLAAFFRRHGETLAITRDSSSFRPGDLVTWRLISGLPHIGIVSDRKSGAGVPLVLHNIGAGAKEDDILFAYPITGHYRYFPGARPTQSNRSGIRDAAVQAP